MGEQISHYRESSLDGADERAVAKNEQISAMRLEDVLLNTQPRWQAAVTGRKCDEGDERPSVGGFQIQPSFLALLRESNCQCHRNVSACQKPVREH